MKVLSKIVLLFMLFFDNCFNINSRFVYHDTNEEENRPDFTKFHKRSDPVPLKSTKHFHVQKFQGDENVRKTEIRNNEQRESRYFKHERRNANEKHLFKREDNASKEQEKGEGTLSTSPPKIKENNDVTTKEPTESNLVTTEITPKPTDNNPDTTVIPSKTTKDITDSTVFPPKTTNSNPNNDVTTKTLTESDPGEPDPVTTEITPNPTDNKPDATDISPETTSSNAATTVKPSKATESYTDTTGNAAENITSEKSDYENENNDNNENEYNDSDNMDYQSNTSSLENGNFRPNGLETDVDDPNDIILHLSSRSSETNDHDCDYHNPSEEKEMTGNNKDYPQPLRRGKGNDRK
ncbi:dual specificity protein kinase shkD-like [Mercenaria mercenaria]|uniref:dual specificity protein kinase shkD-like n=1 Tax=Mercenaria mercenaria TaxID=6596 RepID=UPI00234F98F8|nr:dual specificity protein kinase shkD-like [Mercenaria mercenaria]